MEGKSKLKNIGNKIFKLGIFLIPSAVAFSGILLLFACLIGIMEAKNKFYKEFWNLPIYFATALLVITCILQNILNLDIANNLTWIGLLNWIPLFFLFIGSQNYLEKEEDRKQVAILLLSGSLPVIVTGFAQYFFNFYGPFEFLNGTIVWFLKPIISEHNRGLSGLFSNQNYAGAWFAIIWPFCIAFMLEKTRSLFQKGFSTFFFITVLVSLILTFSRNAYGGLIVSIPLLLGSSSLLWLLPLLILFLFATSNLNFIDQLEITNSYTLKVIINKMGGFRGFEDKRFQIWLNTINLISNRPLLGWGAGMYSLIYFSNFEEKINHSHNLFLEVAFNYGILSALIIFILIITIGFLSMRKIFFNIEEKNLNYAQISYSERAWWTSFFVLLLSQMIDVQYYDGKISIVFWILLAGLKNIIKQ